MQTADQRGQASVVAGELEVVASGYRFTEGPVWDAVAGELVFSDIPGDALHRWSPARGAAVLRSPSDKTNGNALDLAGRLVSCEHRTSRVVRREPGGAVTVLAGHFEGRALNSPNDVVVASDGSVFFTDPPVGRTLADMGEVRQAELDFAGVYRIAPDGRLHLLTRRCVQPNGLCLTDDEDELLVNDTATGDIWRFRLRRDGARVVLDDERRWARIPGDATGSVDGMKFDSAGRLFCTGPGGIHVLDAAARHVATIAVPEVVGNFTWGDADLRTLYVCASTSVYRIRTTVAGRSPVRPVGGVR